MEVYHDHMSLRYVIVIYHDVIVYVMSVCHCLYVMKICHDGQSYTVFDGKLNIRIILFVKLVYGDISLAYHDQHHITDCRNASSLSGST